MKISIYGVPFKIQFADLPDNIAGLCVYDEKKIYIHYKTATEEEIWTTLLHEIGHALLIRCGVAQTVSSDVIEIIVETYSMMLNEFISKTERDRILKKLIKKAKSQK